MGSLVCLCLPHQSLSPALDQTAIAHARAGAAPNETLAWVQDLMTICPLRPSPAGSTPVTTTAIHEETLSVMLLAMLSGMVLNPCHHHVDFRRRCHATTVILTWIATRRLSGFLQSALQTFGPAALMVPHHQVAQTLVGFAEGFEGLHAGSREGLGVGWRLVSTRNSTCLNTNRTSKAASP